MHISSFRSIVFFLVSCGLCQVIFTPAMAASRKPKVLLLDVTSKDLSASEIETMTNLAAVHLGTYPELDVISGQEVKNLIGVEAQRQSLGCDQSSCLVEIADALGADLVVFGQAGKIGTGPLVITLSLFHREKSTAIARVPLEVDRVESIGSLLPGALDQLFASLLGPRRTAPPVPPSVSLGSRARAAYDAEAFDVCADVAEKDLWAFCNARGRTSENAFIRAYQKKTGAKDLDDKIADRVPDTHYVSVPLMAGGGLIFLGGAGIAGANVATGGKLNPYFEKNATISGAGIAAVGVAIAAAGVGVFLFLEPRFDDGKATDHSMTEPEGKEATQRFNAALADEVKKKYAD